MAINHQVGRKGEAIARAHLVASGYKILDENWCYRKAEVDLIAWKNQTLVFVEVKARSSVSFGEPEDFVDRAKQRNLQKAAEQYIYIMNFNGEIRFDIIAILFEPSGKYRLKHIEDAFWG